MFRTLVVAALVLISSTPSSWAQGMSYRDLEDQDRTTIDTNDDGRITRTEFRRFAGGDDDAVFRDEDRDHNGIVEGREYASLLDSLVEFTSYSCDLNQNGRFDASEMNCVNE